MALQLSAIGLVILGLLQIARLVLAESLRNLFSLQVRQPAVSVSERPGAAEARAVRFLRMGDVKKALQSLNAALLRQSPRRPSRSCRLCILLAPLLRLCGLTMLPSSTRIR